MSASHDRTLRVWDLATDECSAELNHAGPVLGVYWDLDVLASRSGDGTVRTWDLASGQTTGKFQHDGPVTAVVGAAEHSRDAWGRLLASGAQDGVVRIWDLRTGGCATSVKVHTGGVAALAVADGFLVSAGDDGDVAVVDGRAGRARPFATLVEPAFALLGSREFLAASPGGILALDVVRHAELYSFRTPSPVRAVCASERFAVLAREDGRVQICG